MTRRQPWHRKGRIRGGATFRERLQLELAHLELLPEVLKVLWRVLRRWRIWGQGGQRVLGQNEADKGGDAFWAKMRQYEDKGGGTFWVRVTVRVAVCVFAVCVWVWMNVLMNVRMNQCRCRCG